MWLIPLTTFDTLTVPQTALMQLIYPVTTRRTAVLLDTVWVPYVPPLFIDGAITPTTTLIADV